MISIIMQLRILESFSGNDGGLKITKIKRERLMGYGKRICI